MLKSWELPLWNVYNYSGIPLLATLQPGVFYPPHVLYFLLPFNIAWNWLIIFHFVFAGFSVYLFLRYLKASWTASFIGGTIFMLSGYLLSVHNLITHLFAVPWFPLVLLSYMKYFETPKKKYLVQTTVFLSMEFLAGAPEIVLMTFLVLVIFSIRKAMLSWISLKDHFQSHSLYMRIKKLIAPAFIPIIWISLLFLLVTAVQLIPFVELKQYSIRKAGLSYEEATIWSFAWRDFILFFLPDAFGSISKFDYVKFWSCQSWLKTMYIGFIPVILTVFYFIKSNRLRITFSVLMVVSFIFALGGTTSVYKLLHHFPPFNSIRYPIKFLFPFFFAIAVMSAIGLDSIIKGVKEKERKTNIFINVVFYLGCFIAFVWGYVNIFESNVNSFFDHMGWKPGDFNDISFNLHNLKRLLFFSLLFCMTIFFYLRVKKKKIFLIILVFLPVLDLFLANYGFYYSLPWKTYIKPYGFAEKLSKSAETGGRYLVTFKTMKELELVFSKPPLDKMAFAPPYASLYRAYSLDGSEVMRIMHYDLFLQVLLYSPNLDYAKRFFDISNLQYIMTSYEIDDDDFALSTKMKLNDRDIYLYEYMKRPGRLSLYGKTINVKNDKEAIEKLVDKKVDLRKELIISSGRRNDNTGTDSPVGYAKLISYRSNKVTLEYIANRDAFLYLSDTYYPGWRAYVDGKETKIYRANLAFRAIKVPGGRHTVVFKYVPMSFYIGLVLTLLGIALCVWLWRRDRKMVSVSEDEKVGSFPDDKGSGV